MNIAEKFAKGAVAKTYQRVDCEYKVNIFIGYNEKGQKSLVIAEPGKETLVKSSRLIDVNIGRRDDNKIALSFDLIDDSYESIFYIFCKDIILVCERAGSCMAISTALARWKYWKDLFGRRSQNILTENSIKGLIGELLELRDFFLIEYDETSAIQSWMGPLLGHKDFEIDNTWFEIKTVNENTMALNISSLEQLESDIDGHLVIVRLEKSNSVSRLAINLNKVVASVIDKLENPENLELFRTRLDNMGYIPDKAYDEFNYIFKGKESYKVTSLFPRIRRQELHKSIANVNYMIMLDGLSEFKEQQKK